MFLLSLYPPVSLRPTAPFRQGSLFVTSLQTPICFFTAPFLQFLIPAKYKQRKEGVIYMPIRIPEELPAAKTLQDENIFVMDIKRVVKQDIRPLHILILNLMPTKIAAETQLARLLGNTPLQIEIELLAVSGRIPKHTAKEHMLALEDMLKEQNKYSI